MRFFSVPVLLVFSWLITATPSLAQISEKDSTVQVVGYWSKNDKQSFLITHDKYTINRTANRIDTLDRKITKSEVDVTVIDSTATSYTIEWLYKTVKSNSKDPLEQKYYRLTQNTKLVIETDELGAFRGVMNIKELQEFALYAAELLKKDTKGIKNADATIKAMLAVFESKESIEGNLIEEIYQFYFFHGGKYKLYEPVNIKLELPNASGGKPIPAELGIRLTEINAADNNFFIRSSQLVDKAQATEATYRYLKQTNELAADFPRDQMPEVSIEETIGSRIHVSGWPVHSIKTKTVTSENSTDVDQWIIDLQ